MSRLCVASSQLCSCAHVHCVLYTGDFIPSQKIQEFVLEAMLFCKKAQCESSMSEEQKQELAT